MDKFAHYPPQDKFEFEFLCQLIRERQPEHIFEIGSRYGQSALRLAEAAMPSIKRLTCLDLPGGPWGKIDSEEPLLKMLGQLEDRGVRTTLHRIDSTGPDAQALANKTKDVDFLFIDGDHKYPGVSSDYYRFSKCVKSGGLIALHDIKGTHKLMGVPKFWNELHKNPKLNTREVAASLYGLGLVFVD